MKITKKLEAEIIQVMDSYWSSYLNGDLETWASFLPENYRNIGTTQEEIWNSKNEIVDYTHKVIDQMVGMAEVRNKETQVISFEPYIMAHELGDVYVKMETGWSFYAKIRLSTLLEKTDDGWKVLHQHGSYPDSKTAEGETFAFDTLKAENAKLQEAVKNRTVELESKNKEFEIEIALEKVRVKAMAMHTSKDVGNATEVLFNELENLGIKTIRCGIIIGKKEERKIELWTATAIEAGNVMQIIGEVDVNIHPLLQGAFEAWEQKSEFFSFRLEGKDKERYYHSLSESLDYPISNRMSSLPDHYCTSFMFEEGGLFAFTFEPFSVENIEIFKRFSVVFSLTYRRYLDLKLAEEQAREAKIEAALERVRSRSLAMHTPNELGEVVTVIVEKLKDLGVVLDANGVVLCTYFKDSKDVLHWIVSPDFSFTGSYLLPYFDHPIFSDAWESKESGAEYFSKAYSKEEKDSFFEYAFEHSDYRHFPDDFKKWVFQNDKHILSFAWQKNSAILIPSHTGVVPSANEVEILKRFARVFEQAYVRFLDLQKAEAQAREAQIEAALEKVRSSSLAMHNSDQLREIVKVVFEKLKELKFAIDGGAFVGTISNNSDYLDYWVGDDHAEYPGSFKIPNYDAPTITDVWDAKKSGIEFISKTYSFKEKNIWFEYAFNHTDFKNALPEDFKKWILEQEYLTQSFALQKNSMIGVHFHHAKTLTENEIDILKRFSRVFEQSYVRFLDLQKAETQTRESEIQLALERVRARSLSMHKSDELQEVITIINQQLNKTGIKADAVAIIIPKPETNQSEIWTSTFDYTYSQKVIMPLSPEAGIIALDLKEAFTLQTDGTKCYSFEEKNTWWNFMLENSDFRNISEERKRFLLESPVLNLIAAVTKNAALTLSNYSDEKFQETDILMLKRFANVFEQAYIRFLDLQKAEAQAREAQIEAALERVRSRTMGMQHSDELQEAAVLLFQQVIALGVPAFGSGFNIWDDDRKFATAWMAGQDRMQPPFKTSSSEDIFLQICEAAQKGESLFVEEQEGEALKRHYEYMKSIPVFKEIADKMASVEQTFPTFQIMHSAFFSHGYLMFITFEPVPDSYDIFRRFAKVFEQTYTRFLDLKKAEKQAQEAQIEAALERVRSRTMGMQHSNELQEAAALLFQQVVALGVPAFSTGFNIWEKGEKECTGWMSDPSGGGMNPVYHIPLTEDANFIRFYESKQNEEDFYVLEMRGERMQEHYRYLRKIDPEFDQTFHELEQKGIKLPEMQIHHLVNFDHGNVMFITLEPVPEAHDIFRRFGKVFEQTYTRFLDLQKAEAQAREAIKQASLDRVRGEIASMRTTDDLSRITPLIWKELIALGVPFIRCGVLIMDENREIIHTYLSAPDGHSLSAFELAFDSEEIGIGTVKHWRKNEIYHLHWDKNQFVSFMQNLIKKGKVDVPESYQGSAAPPESLFLNFVPFAQGMLYIGNVAPLSDDKIELAKTLADAFSIAYARYEDFDKLEKAKESIERTLTELKATQSQLVQAEKMASLGELTAGIAHEIQNPLNFVNNFSEVSKELLDEMKEELDKGNMEDAKEIANDVILNLEKINHHGKRAADIVKGMLQHSRTSSGLKEPTDINALADEYLRLSYHGLRAKDKSFNATMKTDFDETIGKIDIIPQDIGRVILNLITNAFYVVDEKKKQLQNDYEPTISVSTKKNGNQVSISVKDNGNGIPDSIKDKIFQPFFTTKPTGSGTGLGLSLSYDIVKAHGGEIKVESVEGKGTEFIIQLPVV